MFRLIFLLVTLCFSIETSAAIVVGNPQGAITVIEVFDYQCPHCHDAYPVLEKLIDHNRDVKVRLMPVAILNQRSIYEAAAAIAATPYRGKFQALTNLVMSEPPLTTKAMTKTLTALALNSPRFERRMHSQMVERQMMEGLKYLKVEQSGTPLFIVYPTDNSKISAVFRGYQSFSVLQNAIREARHAG